MKVILPIRIDEGKLLDSNIQMEPYGDWDAETVYRRGRRALVRDPGVQRIYESLYPNKDHYPPDNTQGSYPAWREFGPMSMWAMFQEVPDLQSVNHEVIEFTIAPGEDFDTVALHGLQSRFVMVEFLNENDEVVFSKTEDLEYLVPERKRYGRRF